MPHFVLVELTRGACAVFASNYIGLSTLLKGLTNSYNRDLQWDKKFLFDSVETVEELLEVFKRMVSKLTVDKKRAEKQFLKLNSAGTLQPDDALYATDLADYLVRKGVPFAQAHEQVGHLVNLSEEKDVSIRQIRLDRLKKFAPKLERDVYDLFDRNHSVKSKKTIGSTNPRDVKKQISLWKKRLKNASF